MYKKSLIFYDAAKKLNLNFIPQVLLHEENQDRAILLIENVGRDLEGASSWMTSNELYSAALKALDILCILEDHKIMPGNAKARNFVLHKTADCI